MAYANQVVMVALGQRQVEHILAIGLLDIFVLPLEVCHFALHSRHLVRGQTGQLGAEVTMGGRRGEAIVAATLQKKPRFLYTWRSTCIETPIFYAFAFLEYPPLSLSKRWTPPALTRPPS